MTSPHRDIPPPRPRPSQASRAIHALVLSLVLAPWVGAALVVAGALLAWVTDQSGVSLAVAGLGVLLIFVGMVARGYWP